MKARINLYQDQYKPKLSLLSLSSTVFFNGFTIVFVSLLFAFLSWRNNELNERNLSLNAQIDNAQNRVDSLQASLANRQPNPALLASIEQQQIALEQRQKLLEELSTREQIKQNRFSLVLKDLSLADTPGVWLTQIQVIDGQVNLHGYGSKADAMPKWLANLSATESFKGRTFESASMQRDETAIAFSLNADLSATASSRSSQ